MQVLAPQEEFSQEDESEPQEAAYAQTNQHCRKESLNMSATIHALEQLGRNPVGSSAGAYAAIMASSELGPSERRAILDCDSVALSELVGGRETMRCLIWQGDDKPA